MCKMPYHIGSLELCWGGHIINTKYQRRNRGIEKIEEVAQVTWTIMGRARGQIH